MEATNNRAERALRFGVLWRKRSSGTDSVKGNRWVERILSLRQTCRQRGQSSFGVLVDALSSAFSGRQPDLAWLYQSPCLSTPRERVPFRLWQCATSLATQVYSIS